MATRSSILAWDIPWTEEPGRLQSMGSQRVRQDWETEHATDLNLLFKPVCLHSCASSYPGSWSLHALSMYYKEVLPSLLAILVLLPQFMSTWSDGLIYPFQNLTVLAGKIWLPGWTYDQAISLNSPFLYSTSSYLKKKKMHLSQSNFHKTFHIYHKVIQKWDLFGV